MVPGDPRGWLRLRSPRRPSRLRSNRGRSRLRDERLDRLPDPGRRDGNVASGSMRHWVLPRRPSPASSSQPRPSARPHSRSLRPWGCRSSMSPGEWTNEESVLSGPVRWARRRPSQGRTRRPGTPTRRLRRSGPMLRNRPNRSWIVRDRHDAGDAWALRSPRFLPACSPREPVTRRCRGRLRLRVATRCPTDVGRRRWSRHRRRRPGCPDSSDELPSLDARERHVGERGDRTGGVAPTCGAAAVSVVRAPLQTATAAARWVARVIAHPIRPSPALAFPRSRLSGGSGARRAAVRAPPRRCGSRSGAAWEAALDEQV